MTELTPSEKQVLDRYTRLLERELGPALARVWLFGSAARGDMWSRSQPFHSDIDIVVMTHEPLEPALREGLVKETYPLFLECGRQIAPQFKTLDELTHPSPREQAFASRLQAEGRAIYWSDAANP
jgi:predicted nucleotidyltransferase